MVYTAEPLNYPEGTTLPDLLLELNVNSAPPERPAIIDGISGATVYTYSSLRSTVRRLANYLRTEIKLPHGAVVGVFAANSVRATILPARGINGVDIDKACPF
jgi:acyl-CoA synthetase (AMP-forming)/AMP-acid ligase II